MTAPKTPNPREKAAERFLESFDFHRIEAARTRLLRLLNKTYNDGFKACHRTRTKAIGDNS